MNAIERAMVAIAGLAMVLALAVMFVTSGRYMDLQRLTIADATYGGDIAIHYPREFRRDFFGEWHVFVWDIVKGEARSYCEANGAWPYTEGDKDPSKTLEWLVDGKDRCFQLPPGLYYVEVRITANPGSILARTGSVRSNVFEVRE